MSGESESKRWKMMNDLVGKLDAENQELKRRLALTSTQGGPAPGPMSIPKFRGMCAKAQARFGTLVQFQIALGKEDYDALAAHLDGQMGRYCDGLGFLRGLSIDGIPVVCCESIRDRYGRVMIKPDDLLKPFSFVGDDLA